MKKYIRPPYVWILALCLLVGVAGPALAYFLPGRDVAIKEDLAVGTDLSVGNDAAITADATVGGNLTVTGTVTATGGVVGEVSTGTFAAGTESVPGIAYSADGDSGFRLTGANAVSLSLAGSDVVDWTTSGAAVTGTLAVSGATTLAGLLNADAGFAMDTTVFTIANTTGVISHVPTTTTSNAHVLDGTTITSGTMLKMIGVDATLNAGYYLELFGGTNATVVWKVGESGATHIEPNADDIPALWLDCILQAGADALTIELDDDVNTTGLFIECLGGSSHNTSVFSVAEGGAVAVAGTLAAAGNATVGGTLAVTGTQTNAGATALDGGLSMDTSVFTIANTTGVISWVPTSTTQMACTFDGTTITTGTLLKMIGVDATLDTGGRYIEIFGGTNATVVWYVGESGATWIEPNVKTVSALWLDCIVTESGDALTIEMDSDILSGGLFIECLGGASHNTSVFSVAETGAVTIAGALGAAAATFTGNVGMDGGFDMDGTVLSVANTTGVISWVPTSTTQMAATFDGTLLTTGTLLKMIGVDATLDTGACYIEIFGGTNATVVWYVGESGYTHIEPNVNSVPALWLDCIVATTADALTIEMDDDIQAGGLFIECLGGAAHDTTQFNVAEAGVVYSLGKITATGGLDTGTGYSGTGATITAAGAGSFDSNVVAGGTLQSVGAATLASLVCTAGATFGGGAGSTGVSISTAGVLEVDGASELDGTVNFGGSYGSTGVTISDAGAVSMNAALIVDGASTLTGACQSLVVTTIVDADDRVITAADYGKIIVCTDAGASAYTLPANGATIGSHFWVALDSDDNCAWVCSAAAADTLVGFNDSQLDSVTYGAGHRQGALAYFWSDGDFWHVQNLSDCTMTYTS